MTDESKSRKGALFFEPQQGRRKLLGYRMKLGGQMGIAYIKDDMVIDFIPIADFLETFYRGMFLTMTDLAGIDQPAGGADQQIMTSE